MILETMYSNPDWERCKKSNKSKSIGVLFHKTSLKMPFRIFINCKIREFSPSVIYRRRGSSSCSQVKQKFSRQEDTQQVSLLPMIPALASDLWWAQCPETCGHPSSIPALSLTYLLQACFQFNSSVLCTS